MMEEIAKEKNDEVNYNEMLENLRTQWDVPAISCIAISDNRIVYKGSVGLRDIESKLPMTTKTLQPIGSTTKAFTSTAIAMLVNDGLLEWDTPLQKRYPRFMLKDSVISSKITLVDMLSHRTGLPRHDFVWMDDEFTYDQIFDRLPHLDFTTDLRTSFQYCNLMYITAAALVEEISGEKYKSFLSKRIFKPLKMNAKTSMKAMMECEDYARGYLRISDKKRLVKYDESYEAQYQAATGAGEINASISDVCAWLKFHLNKGSINGKKLLDSESVTKMHTPVIPGGYESIDQWIPDQKWVKQGAYALGWHTDVYRGYSRVRHGGNTDGSSTEMCFLPEYGIGVSAIVNEYGCPLPDAVVNTVLDQLLGLDPIDWSALLKPQFDAMRKAFDQTSVHSEALKIPDTKPSRSLDEYLGNYFHPGYGAHSIIRNENSLKLRIGTQILELTHYHYDTFQVYFERFDARELLTFHSESSGDIESFTIRIEARLPPIRFIRLPDEHLSDPDFLKKMEGRYEFFGREVEISLRENVLLFKMPGTSVIELEPVHGMRFRQKGSDVMSITFDSEENGVISGFKVSQLANVIPGKRIKD